MLDPIPIWRRKGTEPFHDCGSDLGFDLLSFWRWYASDLTGNALRGCIAEYLVAKALGGAIAPRREWDEVDIRLPSGACVEVKSASYHQSWPQKEESEIRFSIAATQGWNALTGALASMSTRVADVYVFCVLAHRDRTTLDPLDVAQWEFYVMHRRVLEARVGDQKTIGLEPLRKIEHERVGYRALVGAIDRALCRTG